MNALLKLAAEERRDLGYITDQTRDALHSMGLTSVEIEAAIIKTTRGPKLNG